MLRMAIVFFVIALVAAFLGFGGVAALSWEGAKILFLVFLILAVLSLLGHRFRGKPWYPIACIVWEESVVSVRSPRVTCRP